MHGPAADDVKSPALRGLEQFQGLGHERRILGGAMEFGAALRYLDRSRRNVDPHYLCAPKSQQNGVAAIAASQLQNALTADIAEQGKGELGT